MAIDNVRKIFSEKKKMYPEKNFPKRGKGFQMFYLLSLLYISLALVA